MDLSLRERDRISVLRQVSEGVLTVAAAEHSSRVHPGRPPALVGVAGLSRGIGPAGFRECSSW